MGLRPFVWPPIPLMVSLSNQSGEATTADHLPAQPLRGRPFDKLTVSGVEASRRPTARRALGSCFRRKDGGGGRPPFDKLTVSVSGAAARRVRCQGRAR